MEDDSPKQGENLNVESMHWFLTNVEEDGAKDHH